jgi:hypothetical protein
VECSIFYGIKSGAYGFNDGRLCSAVSIGKTLGFWILNPEYSTNYENGHVSNGFTYFNTVVIFTPKPGLFDETPPT